MVKRYSDLSRTLIKRTGVSNPNMGRIDPRPATQFFNTLSKVADQAQSTYTTLAKDKAIQDGVKDGKTFGVTFDENGVPQYNPPEVGGLYYQNAFEKAATIEYKESIQDSIAKKVDDGYRSWLDNPDNINDMEALQSSMTGGVEGILESVPDQFKNFAGSKANDRISSNLNNEYKKLASRKYNQLSNNLTLRINNLIDDMANTTFDSPERTPLTERFEEAMEALVKLNFGDTDVAMKATKEFQEAGNINAFISDVFHANEDGEYINLKKLEAIKDVLNGSAETVTITQKNGQDLVVDREFVLNKFNSDATRNRLIERIGKARAVTNEKLNNTLSATTKLQDSSFALQDVLTLAIRNNNLTYDFVDAEMKKFDTTFNTIMEETNIDSDSTNFKKLVIEKNKIKENFKRQAYDRLYNIEDEQSKAILKIDRTNILKDINDSSKEIETIHKDIKRLKKTNPTDETLNLLDNIITEDPDRINTIRSLIPSTDSPLWNAQYLTGLKNAIDTGSASTDGMSYTIGTKSYTADAIHRLFSGLEPVKSQLVNQLQNEIVKFNTNIKKQNINLDIANVLTDKADYAPNAKPADLNNFFVDITLKENNIDAKNLDAFFNEPDPTIRKNNIDKFVTLAHQHMTKLNHMPTAINAYLDRPAPTLEKFKAKVELFSHLKKNEVAETLLDTKKYAKLEAALSLPADNEHYQAYYTNLKTLFSLSNDNYLGAENQFFRDAGMESPENATKNAKKQFIKTHMFKEFSNKKNDIEMQNVFDTLDDGLIAIGTIATYNQSVIGDGSQNIMDLLTNTFKARLNTIEPVKNRFIIGAKYKTDSNVTAISDAKDLYQPNTIAGDFHAQVSKVINGTGGNSNYTQATIAIINLFKEEQGNILFDIGEGFEVNDIGKLFEKEATGRVTQKYGQPYIDPEQSYLQTTKLKSNAYPITDNFPSGVEMSIKDFFTVTDNDGDQIQLIPGKTFRLEPVISNGVTEGYKIVLIGSQTGALDANASDYIQHSYVQNAEGEHLVIPLNELLHDNNKFIEQSNTKQLLLEQESVESRERTEGEPPDLSVGTGGRSVAPFVPKFDKFTPIQVGENKLKTNEVVNINQQELKYINLHRMILGTHNGVLNTDGSLSTARGMIIDTTSTSDSYGATPRKQYHLVPSVIAYTDTNNNRKYRVIQPGEQNLLEEYIASVGGLNKFPVYNSLEEAQKEERKLKKIIADDYRTYKGIDQPDFSYTVNKSTGRDMVVEGVNYILNLTANNNEANRRFMIATIGTESKFGIDERTYREGRVSTGIAQFDKITFDDETGEEIVGIFDDLKRRHSKELKANSYGMAGTGLPPIFGRTVKKIEDAINRDFPDLLNGRKFEVSKLNYNDLNNPLVSIAMLRLWMATQGATSTYDTPSEAYWLYKNVYNTNLKLDTQKKFENFWNE